MERCATCGHRAECHVPIAEIEALAADCGESLAATKGAIWHGEITWNGPTPGPCWDFDQSGEPPWPPCGCTDYIAQ